MKLFNGKEDSLYLTRKQWTKLFVAFSIMVLVLYAIAMICSLCGIDYFILKFQNTQLDKIEEFMQARKLQPLISWIFNTIEFGIVISFILKRFPKWYYVLCFYALAMIVSATMPFVPIIFYQIYPFIFYLIIPIFDKKPKFKQYLFCVLRLAIAVLVTYTLQVMIYVIKDGNWSFSNNIMSLSTHFIYAIEYDIALAVILFTILLVYREKGDSKLWVMFHTPGGFSQNSMKQSQKSNTKKNLTKTQKRKIRWLYFKLYVTQIGAFSLLMILPFVLGKLIEFLIMYLAFAIARYILGFNYSLHYKKESICITVGAVVFGILSLAVPFFYVNMIVAIVMGIGLAILLHLSYKYKGFYLFNKMARPDKFALLYTFFDGDISEHHVKVICHHKGLDKFQTQIIWEFMEGNKISYIAFKHNYSQRMMIYKIDEAIDKLLD